jgi:hypothetical protein
VVLFVIAAGVLVAPVFVLVVAVVLLAAVAILPMAAATQRLILPPGSVAHVPVLHPVQVTGPKVQPLALAMSPAAVAVSMSLRILLLGATAPWQISEFVHVPLLVVGVPCSQGRPSVIAVPVLTIIPLRPASLIFAAALSSASATAGVVLEQQMPDKAVTKEREATANPSTFVC